MIVVSPKMQVVYQQALLCAQNDVDVLLLGESGTGKEVLAQAIHQHSRRAGKPFVALNCGSIPTTLLASEFFGHERGAFTDAKQRRIGRFEQAQGGTLFLDEIGDLSLKGQVALLRALETRRVERLGNAQGMDVDVRIIAATNQDLWQRVQDKKFRGDLYWRLNVISFTLPPLRQRPEDIPPLVDHFLREFQMKLGKELTLTPAAHKLLRWYHYPGNVRELKNILWRAAALCGGNPIDEAHLTFTDTRGLEAFEIRKSIEQCGGVKAAARKLGYSRQTLYKKLKRGLRPL